MASNYLFTSDRLGFRAWKTSDLDALHKIFSNERVMRYFPKTLSKEETAAFIVRMQEMQQAHGHCFFATELKDSGILTGFIGLSIQDFKASFTPLKDIGWRLDPQFWRQGYATEGAGRCMEFAQNTLGWTEVYAIAPEINTPSRGVMEKLGMQKLRSFKHPKLDDHPHLQECLLYKKTLQPMKSG